MSAFDRSNIGWDSMIRHVAGLPNTIHGKRNILNAIRQSLFHSAYGDKHHVAGRYGPFHALSGKVYENQNVAGSSHFPTGFITSIAPPQAHGSALWDTLPGGRNSFISRAGNAAINGFLRGMGGNVWNQTWYMEPEQIPSKVFWPYNQQFPVNDDIRKLTLGAIYNPNHMFDLIELAKHYGLDPKPLLEASQIRMSLEFQKPLV